MKSYWKIGRKKLSAAAGCLAAGISVCLLTACAGQESAERYRTVDTVMGTIITQDLYIRTDTGNPLGGAGSGKGSDATDIAGDGEISGAAVAAELLGEIRALEEKVLSWRLDTSEVYRINAGAGKPEGTEVSAELEGILQKAAGVAADSGGALDITIGEVTRLWDIDKWAGGEKEGVYMLPEPAAVAEALSRAGCEKVRLEKGRVYLPEGTGLDLGAVGKGAACARLAELLADREEVSGAVISAGGNILTYGAKPDGSPWRIGVADPRKEGEYLGYLTLEGQWFVSTTGDYERYVIVDGVRYHHVMDPHTGYPARSGVISATILTKDGLLGDALSTACFVLGAEDGRTLAERYGAEALFVDEEGGITMTEGMKGFFRLS